MSDSEESSDNSYRSRNRSHARAPPSLNPLNLEVRAPTAADLLSDVNESFSSPSAMASASDMSSPSINSGPVPSSVGRSPFRFSPFGRHKSTSSYSSRSRTSMMSRSNAVSVHSAPLGNGLRSYNSSQTRGVPSLMSSMPTSGLGSLKTRNTSMGTRSLVSSANPYGMKEIVQFMAASDIINDADDDYRDKSSEFVMRYTPVECEAEHFDSKYTLRTMENQRNIKVFIVVTMYNEDVDELKRTLKGIIRNIETFIEKLGEDAWKEICMCIVGDGRHKADKGSLDFLQDLKIFDADAMHSALDESTHIKMHLFESTLLIPSENMSSPSQPLQTIFAVKERNGGKLDSHHWFFNAFSKQIRPKYCFMFDVGTKPEHSAILKLFHCMERNPNVGGCCGEITTRVTASINPWIAAQQFEYKIATILEKSMESVFGYISVLPGAFSAYRYQAIEGQPLSQYFKQINTDLVQISPFKGNMYLAEDRILCFEVLAEKDCRWTLKYVADAKAATDVPEALTDLIKQRRRWLNGSLFAMIYAIGNFSKFVSNSAHSRLRKMFVSVQFWFYALQLIMQWFLVAQFYLMFEFAAEANEIQDHTEVKIFRALFLIITLIQFVAGLGNRPDELPMIYFFCAVGYGIFFFYVLGINAALLVRKVDYSEYTDVAAADSKRTETVYAQVAALAGLAVYFGAAILHGQLFAICVSIAQYFFMLPTFLIGFPIYSFCNIHDISWGTKGLETSDMAEGATRKQKEMHAQVLAKRKQDLETVDARFRTFRSNMVIAWLASNALFFEIITKMSTAHETYIFISYGIFFGINAFKFLFCFVFVLSGWISSCRHRRPAKDDAARVRREQLAPVQQQQAAPDRSDGRVSSQVDPTCV